MENLKFSLDLASIGVVVATLVSWLPPIAAVASIIWTTIQIYEWYKHKDK